jgi:hypothetical protein
MVTETGTTAVPLAADATPTPVDVSRLLVASEVPNGPVPLGLWALYDTHHSVARLSAQLKDGQSVTAQGVALHGQPGALFMVMAPRDQVTQLLVHPPHGAATSYSATNPPGYRR